MRFFGKTGPKPLQWKICNNNQITQVDNDKSLGFRKEKRPGLLSIYLVREQTTLSFTQNTEGANSQ